MALLSRRKNAEKPVNIELSPRHRENAPGAGGGKAEIMKSQISNYPGREKNSIHQGVPAAITSTGSYRPLTNSRPGLRRKELPLVAISRTLVGMGRKKGASPSANNK